MEKASVLLAEQCALAAVALNKACLIAEKMERNSVVDLTVPAFMMDGLRDVGLPSDPYCYQKVLAAWDQGCYELIAEMVQHSMYASMLADAGYKLIGDMPGVFNYEVVSEFGKWFGLYVLKSKETPSKKEAEDQLFNETVKFFTQGFRMSNIEGRQFEASLKKAVQGDRA